MLALFVGHVAVALKTVTITFPEVKDEVFATPLLKEFLKENPRPAILMRVPGLGNGISNTDVTSDLYNLSNDDKARLYNSIEKNLLINGYIVRDRAIFDKVVTQTQEIDYSKINSLTNTDLVLEVTNISYQEYHTNQVEKDGDQKTYNCNFKGFWGWKVDIRIVKVKENQVVGLNSFYYVPCTSGCTFGLDNKCNLISLDGKKTAKKDKDGNYIPFMYKETDGVKMERFGNQIASKILKTIK